MRGLGNVYKRGPVWWVRYHHRGREYRESARSKERADAVTILKQRVGALRQGASSALAEERVTFNSLAQDYLQERKLRGADPKAQKWSDARLHPQRVHQR
jgi:hypothetical protein